MASPKTQPTDTDPDAFLAAVPHAQRRADAAVVDTLMREVTGEPPVIWGTSIVGYGAIAYPGSGGRTTSWPVVAFAPRKTELVLYLNTELPPELFEGLGPHRRGAGCLYLKKLTDVDLTALRTLFERSVELATR